MSANHRRWQRFRQRRELWQYLNSPTDNVRFGVLATVSGSSDGGQSLSLFWGELRVYQRLTKTKGQDGKFDESRDSAIGVHNPGFTPLLDANEFLRR